MNKTTLEHFIVGLVFVLIPSLILFSFFGYSHEVSIGLALVINSVFLGREISQHEYKLSTKRGWSYGEVYPIKWYEGLVKEWSKDSILDVIAPIIATILAIIVLGVIYG